MCWVFGEINQVGGEEGGGKTLHLEDGYSGWCGLSCLFD